MAFCKSFRASAEAALVFFWSSAIFGLQLIQFDLDRPLEGLFLLEPVLFVASRASLASRRTLSVVEDCWSPATTGLSVIVSRMFMAQSTSMVLTTVSVCLFLPFPGRDMLSLPQSAVYLHRHVVVLCLISRTGG